MHLFIPRYWYITWSQLVYGEKYQWVVDYNLLMRHFDCASSHRSFPICCCFTLHTYPTNVANLPSISPISTAAMSSNATEPTSHPTQECIHTCMPAPCTSCKHNARMGPLFDDTLWPIGSSIIWHERNPLLHRNCAKCCPGWDLLQGLILELILLHVKFNPSPLLSRGNVSPAGDKT